MTDGELVRRVVAGDTAAYGELARRWFCRILALCQSRVFSTDAEDLAQETLLRGYVNLSTLADPELFGPWVRRIAANICTDWRRSHLGQRRATDCPLELAAAPDAGSPMGEDERTIIVGQIGLIPEELREVILLRYYADLTYDEMASWLEVSRATVNERLAKARALLRIRLAFLRSEV